MGIETLTGTVALIMGFVCGVAGLYIWNVYRQRYENGLLLRRIILRNVRVSIAGFALSAMVAYSYLVSPIPRPWGAVVIGLCVIAFEWGAISDALLVYRERRRPTGATE